MCNRFCERFVRAQWSCFIALAAVACVTGGCVTGERGGDNPDSFTVPEVSKTAPATAPEGAAAAQAHYERGNARFDAGDYDGAEGEYRRALELDPNLAKAHTNLGLCLRRLGDLPGAVAEYRRALELDGADITTLQNLSVAQRLLQDAAGLVETIERLVELQPDDVFLKSDLAQTLYAAGRYEEALRAFEQVVAADPGMSHDFYMLGLCQYNLGRRDDALTTWLAASTHDPLEPSIRKGIAVLYWESGDYTNAWEAVKQCQALSIPLDPEFLDMLRRDSGKAGPE